jgi:serine/threonine protein phosphatase PrpC
VENVPVKGEKGTERASMELNDAMPHQMQDHFLIIGCDGVWDKFSLNDAVAFVAAELFRAEVRCPAGTCGTLRLTCALCIVSKAPISSQASEEKSGAISAAQRAANASAALANEAVKRGSSDNVSVLIVTLG